MKRNVFFYWGLIVLAGSLALAARYGLVEPAAMSLICDADHGPWWCQVRMLIIRSFATFGLGYLSLMTSVLALITRTVGFGLLAAIVGVMGLTLYCQEPAVISFMLGTLILARACWPTQGTRTNADSHSSAGG